MEAVVTLHPAAAGRWALCGPGHDADRPRMAWFLRAIEQTDGSWACKHQRKRRLSRVARVDQFALVW